MGHFGQVQSQVLPLISRALWAEGVLLNEAPSISPAAIRGEFHRHLLRTLDLPLLGVENQARDMFRAIKFKHDLFPGVRPRTHPSCSSPARCPVEQMFDRVL